MPTICNSASMTCTALDGAKILLKILKAAVIAVQVLTPMQRARSSIEGYPYHIDVFSLVDIMAMQASDAQSAQSLLVVKGYRSYFSCVQSHERV